MNKGWPFSLCSLAILSITGLAWGQVNNSFQGGTEKPFLQPYSPESNNQSLDASYKTISDNNARHKNVAKIHKVIVTTAPNSPKSTFGRHKKSGLQPVSPKIGSAGTSLNFQGYNQQSNGGTGSFLDGYLLRSLNEKGIARKKDTDDKKSDATMHKKRKNFIK